MSDTRENFFFEVEKSRKSADFQTERWESVSRERECNSCKLQHQECNVAWKADRNNYRNAFSETVKFSRFHWQLTIFRCWKITEKKKFTRVPTNLLRQRGGGGKLDPNNAKCRAISSYYRKQKASKKQLIMRNNSIRKSFMHKIRRAHAAAAVCSPWCHQHHLFLYAECYLRCLSQEDGRERGTSTSH